MRYEVLTAKGEKIILEDNPISKPGAEGEVRKIISPAYYTNNCVKIYHKNKRTEEKERKIRFMIDNTPKPHAQVQSMLLIGWPIEIIYSVKYEFLGFMMTLAFPGSEKLSSCLTSTKKLSGDWLKFAPGSGLINRYQLMLNIAGFMYLLHHTGKYILGDFKPDNVMVTPSGQITIIDTDSVQITEGLQLIHQAAMATPNYRPPEYYSGVGQSAATPLEKSWDCFSLSVVFYELLMGLHPYNGVTPNYPRDDNRVTSNIRDDLFPFGGNANKIKGFPPPHNKFKYLPVNLQNLFIHSFSLNANQRPSVGEWSKNIREILQGTNTLPSPNLSQSYPRSPNPPPPPLGTIYLTTYPTTLSFEAGGSTKTVNVSTSAASYDVTNLPASAWCYVANKTDTSFQLVCKPNNTNSMRNETIKVKAGNQTVDIVVEQEEQEVTYIDVNSQTLLFDAKGSTETVYVTTNCKSFKVTNTQPWCSVVEKSASSFKIKYEPNKSKKARKDYFSIEAGQIIKRIEVKQEAKPSLKPWVKIAATMATIALLAGVSYGGYMRFFNTPSASLIPIINQGQADEPVNPPVETAPNRVAVETPTPARTSSNENPTTSSNTTNATNEVVNSPPRQSMFVYVESVERNLNQPSTILTNRLTSALSAKGYNFIDDRAQAGFRLKVTATTRFHNTEFGLTVCYADVAIIIYNGNRSIFQDEISQKGVSSSREAAGRKALEDAVPILVDKIPSWNELNK